MGIYLKLNLIAQLDFEHAYNDSVVQQFNSYTMRTPIIFLKLRIVTSRHNFSKSYYHYLIETIYQ